VNKKVQLIVNKKVQLIVNKKVQLIVNKKVQLIVNKKVQLIGYTFCVFINFLAKELHHVKDKKKSDHR
jgi:hypothetical protein